MTPIYCRDCGALISTLLPLHECIPPHQSIPTADERAGMDWWNGLSENKRGLWLRRSKGQSAADAWAFFKKTTMGVV